ncbi:hypothetical protein QQF64_018718 [Cirrhinus molitorella]|uniref:Uncharacterized protein n=1 Tax=Cirrhinus molitorella TaxID=172907 RepID=A0ABR3LDE9_9TELE
MDELDLKKYNTTQEGKRRLIPAVNNCRRALLPNCNPIGQYWNILASALQSSDSPLRELDLSNNELRSEGMKLIFDALKSPKCQLEILRLSSCNLVGECFESLASALQSSDCKLIELDLSNNDLDNSAVKLISDALKSHNRHLKKLSLQRCNLMAETCKIIASALQSSECPLRELDVSNNDLRDSGVKLISGAVKNPNCQLEILRLSGCMVTGEGCYSLASALSLNPSHLRELDLSYNHPEHSAHQLCSYQNDPGYALKILNVEHAGEFRITTGLHKYACNLTLDANTANIFLVLSDENKKGEKQRLKQKPFFSYLPPYYRLTQQLGHWSCPSSSPICSWQDEHCADIFTTNQVGGLEIPRSPDNTIFYYVLQGYSCWNLVLLSCTKHRCRFSDEKTKTGSDEHILREFFVMGCHVKLSLKCILEGQLHHGNAMKAVPIQRPDPKAIEGRLSHGGTMKTIPIRGASTKDCIRRPIMSLHFYLYEKGRNITKQCKLCLPATKLLSASKDSTSNLKKHLERMHPSAMQITSRKRTSPSADDDDGECSATAPHSARLRTLQATPMTHINPFLVLCLGYTNT